MRLMNTPASFNPSAYSAIVTRSYKLPKDNASQAAALFIDRSNRDPACNFVFDDRYLCRRRVATAELGQTELEDASSRADTPRTKMRVRIMALVHRSGYATIINRLDFEKVPPADFIHRLHHAWHKPEPDNRIFFPLQKNGLADAHAESIINLCDVGYLLLTARIESEQNTGSSFDWERARECARQPHRHPDLFPWLGQAGQRPALPTLFGCASVFTVEKLPESAAVLSAPILSDLVSPERREMMSERGFDSASETMRLVLNRNSAVLFSPLREDRNEEIDRLACAFGFLNMVRHFSNSLGTLVSRDLDALAEECRARTMLKVVALRQRELTYLHDELHNLNLWHNPELVRLAHAAYDPGTEWELDNEISKTKNKVEQLIRFTDEMAKTQAATSRRWIRALLVIIGGLQLLEIVPVLPELAAWSTAHLSYLIGAVLVAAITAFFWDNSR